MPAQALILLAQTPRKRKSAMPRRLRQRRELRGKIATMRGLQSVAVHSHRETLLDGIVAPQAWPARPRTRRFGLIKSYTTTSWGRNGEPGPPRYARIPGGGHARARQPGAGPETERGPAETC